MSEGGKGIRFFKLPDEKEALLQWLKHTPDCIVQDVIEQHESLSAIHSYSINTIRIMTLLFNGKVHVLSSVLRMGRNGANVDNASSGGIVCGIDDNGLLKEWAYDTSGNRWQKHPQGTVFKGTQITGYTKCKELAMRLAYRLSATSSLISWDFAVGQDGPPILIECNLTFGEVDFHQMCNGPVFGSLTTEILSAVFQDRSNKK